MARRASAPRAAAVAAELPSPRATHIVLFRNVSEQNAALVRNALAAAPIAGERATMGVAKFAAKTGERATVYGTLGVAAVTADPAEVEKIKSDPAVEDVFVNEERYVPRPVTTQLQSSAFAAEAPNLDYLLGLREGLDTAIAALTGQRRPPSPPQRPAAPIFAEAGDMTWGLRAIGLSPTYRFSGKGVTLAVLDTGIDLEHPDFRGRVSEGTTGRSFVAGQVVQDLHGHGTHCCGTAAGPKTSIGGIRYGVAPDVKLLVGKVLSNSGSGWDDDIVNGINWAVSEGARVVSISLGSARNPDAPYSRLYERVAERLLEERPGTLIIAAAGNESERPAFTKPVGNPAACPSIYSVAAIDRNFAIASFSCRQMDGIGRVDISGPGVGIRSSVPGGRFESFNGTSMATPHVAGAAALYFEAEPALTAAELWDRMLTDSRPLGDPADFGGGIVQVPGGLPPTS
jgi:subtilisin family serine protease